MPPQGAKAILSPSRGYSKTSPFGVGFLLTEKYREWYGKRQEGALSNPQDLTISPKPEIIGLTWIFV